MPLPARQAAAAATPPPQADERHWQQAGSFDPSASWSGFHTVGRLPMQMAREVGGMLRCQPPPLRYQAAGANRRHVAAACPASAVCCYGWRQEGGGAGRCQGPRRCRPPWRPGHNRAAGRANGRPRDRKGGAQVGSALRWAVLRFAAPCCAVLTGCALLRCSAGRPGGRVGAARTAGGAPLQGWAAAGHTPASRHVGRPWRRRRRRGALQSCRARDMPCRAAGTSCLATTERCGATWARRWACCCAASFSTSRSPSSSST
jgi:hypothetical protein